MANYFEQNRNPYAQHPLSLLIVEDDPNDAELCLRVLKRASLRLRWDIVSTQEEFTTKLRMNYYDVIVSDYNLGLWNALDAFNILRKVGRDTPFILVTGALGDERAIECIQHGITDYVLKDRLERLPLAIARALEQRALIDEHQRSERALTEGEARFRMLAEAIPAATFIEQGTRCSYVNSAAEQITGYNRQELMGANLWKLILADSKEAMVGRCRTRHGSAATLRYEVQIRTKQGAKRWLDVTVGMFANEGGLASLITAFDVTEQRHLGDLSRQHQPAVSADLIS
jgi:PAS domain S-box-containing protein